MSARNNRPYFASTNQIGKLERLLTSHGLHEGAYDRLWKRLQAHRTDERTPGDGTRMTGQDASKFIDWLIQKHGDEKPAEMGVYRRQEGDTWRYFVVREFEPDDRPGIKIRYAKELVPLRKTQGSRQSGDGQAVRYDEQPAKGMQWELKPDELMPLEDVEAMSVRFGKCILCGHKLYVDDSQRRGIGPVCAGRQHSAIELRDALALVTDASGARA